MGKSRAVLALNGIVMMTIGVCFFFLNKQINIAMFPGIQENELAYEIAIILRYLMGSGIFTIGMILFLARVSVKSGAQRLLMGSSIGFFIIFLTTLFVKYKFLSVDIPIVGVSIFPILSLLSLYVSTRPYQEQLLIF
tara:strand:+ start:915 stop:1325 length:411 start_codon:yes stop_codon:yes gene_type:complete